MEPPHLHVFFFPFMSPGHLIPMVDMARLFASHGVKSTIITTPLNLSRFRSIIDRHNCSSNYVPIDLHVLDLPFSAAGLPENCENLDSLPSRLMSYNFSKAIMMLQPPSSDLVRRHRPDAIISDLNLPWTAEIAREHGIPRIVFNGGCCFSLSVVDGVARHKPHENVSSDTEPFLVPGLPDPVFITKSHMPERFFGNLDLHEFFKSFMEAERNTYGVVANTFYEIEPEYVDHYKKITGKKVWPVGPVSLCNKKALDMAERGNKASIDKERCLTWLDSKKPNSVLYVSFGSLCTFSKSQLLELGLGLEASNHSFIWVIRDHQELGFVLKDFEERVRDRGLIIRGWAPQVLILNHEAVGGFMTHCGWNSVLESVTEGVPLITWPLFAEQFYNENFVLHRLRIGVGIGVQSGLAWGEEERSDVLMEKDQIAEAVTRLMSDGEMVEVMRKRASRLRDIARSAVEKGGSSYVSVGLLIEDLLNQREERLARDHRVGLAEK